MQPKEKKKLNLKWWQITIIVCLVAPLIVCLATLYIIYFTIDNIFNLIRKKQFNKRKKKSNKIDLSKLDLKSLKI